MLGPEIATKRGMEAGILPDCYSGKECFSPLYNYSKQAVDLGFWVTFYIKLWTLKLHLSSGQAR